jgi:hypothetical protein
MDHKRQGGQALTEGLFVLALFVLLGIAILGVGRLQWQGLVGAHTSRAAAFRYAAGDRETPRQGVPVTRDSHPAYGGPGGARGAALRRELQVEDRGMVTARAAIAAAASPGSMARLTISRHTSILADAGHAADDQRAQQRIAASRQAWGDAARLSLAAGRRALARFKDLDRGWSRAAPDFDWLSPWADLAPRDQPPRARRSAGGAP